MDPSAPECVDALDIRVQVPESIHKPAFEKRREGRALLGRAPRALLDVLRIEIVDVGIEMRDIQVAGADNRFLRGELSEILAQRGIPLRYAVLEPLQVHAGVRHIQRNQVELGQLDGDGAALALVALVADAVRNRCGSICIFDEECAAGMALQLHRITPVRRVARQQTSQLRALAVLKLGLLQTQNVWGVLLNDADEGILELAEDRAQPVDIPRHELQTRRNRSHARGGATGDSHTENLLCLWLGGLGGLGRRRLVAKCGLRGCRLALAALGRGLVLAVGRRASSGGSSSSLVASLALCRR
eukprot:m.68901 g.68901  ORF g.68901 m.68901 type:complete len:301 (-) comp7523_c0_seq3:533-1435(-)